MTQPSERSHEGRRVTPSWWIDHLAARSLLEALYDTELRILRSVESQSGSLVVELKDSGRPDLAAVAGITILEILHKIETHECYIRQAEEHLLSYKNQNIGIKYWPQRPEKPLETDVKYREIVTLLSRLLPELHRSKFDPREPDLYGQVFHFVVEGVFQTIIEQDPTGGSEMYETLVAEMNSARLRILADLEGHDVVFQTSYAIDPILSVMDLAGYALVMFELTGEGMWPSIKEVWDKLLRHSPGNAEFLLAASRFSEDSLMVVGASMSRSRRYSEIETIFKRYNVPLPDSLNLSFWATSERPHSSPIISALASDRYGLGGELYTLFIVEYLQDYLPKKSDLGPRAGALAGKISSFRHQNDKSN